MPISNPAKIGVPEIQPQKGKFKIEICKYFEQGSCKHGKDCTFAHGQTDLRKSSKPQNRPPQSKTKLPPKDSSNIIVKQLEYILNQLGNLYSNDVSVCFSLKNAREMLRENNYQMAADTLHKVINKPALQAINKDLHDKIVYDAQQIGVKLFQDLSVRSDKSESSQRNGLNFEYIRKQENSKRFPRRNDFDIESLDDEF